MSKRSKYQMTAEDHKRHRVKCPECRSRQTYTFMLSHGGGKECYTCDHQWGWMNKQWSSITKEQYDERKHSVSAKRSSAGERAIHSEGVFTMAKKNKSKKKGSKGKKAKSSEFEGLGVAAGKMSARKYACELILSGVKKYRKPKKVLVEVLDKFPDAKDPSSGGIGWLNRRVMALNDGVEGGFEALKKKLKLFENGEASEEVSTKKVKKSKKNKKGKKGKKSLKFKIKKNKKNKR